MIVWLTRDLALAIHERQLSEHGGGIGVRDENLLEDPGEKDLTAHVDFTALSRTAASLGLELAGFADQHHFLVGAGQGILRELSGPPDAKRQKQLRALQTLLHPTTMGTQFSFLGFSRGVPAVPRLSGFQFARPCPELHDLFPLPG